MKKLIILSLSLLSVSCAQASQKHDQHFFPDRHSRKINGKANTFFKNTFFNWFKDDPNLQVKVEESAEDMKRGVYYLGKFGEEFGGPDQPYLRKLISKYVKRCGLKYDNPNDVRRCSFSAIRDITAIIRQNRFTTNRSLAQHYTDSH